MKHLRFLLVLTALAQLAAAGMLDEMVVLDSLREMPRWERVRWLAKRGLPDPYLRASAPADSGPIRVVGRWSYGPSTSVDVKATDTDTLVFLSRGSGVSVIRFSSRDSLRLDLLADINASSLTERVMVQDSLLYVGSGGVEVYDISDPVQPALLGSLSAAIYDFYIVDTFLYTVDRESLAVYSIADPVNPRLLGGCRDSAYVIRAQGNYCYLGDQYGLYIVDVSDPAVPHRVGSIGGDVISVAARDTLLFFGTSEQGLKVYSVANPASPVPLGTLPGIQPAWLYLPPECDTVLYTPVFHAINITDPRNPRIIGQVDCPGWDYGVTAVPALNYALVADYFEGLVAVDVTSPWSPRIDTMLFAGDMVEDICIDGGMAYLASYHAGMQILDVADPAVPRFVGACDTAGRTRTSSVVARDSFVFMTWLYVPFFRPVDVSDPRRPRLAGGLDVPNYPEDMVLRDTLVFCAENRRFQVVNVARPREPVLVGSCELPFDSWEVLLRDTLAFVANVTSLKVINVARPSAPSELGTWSGRTLGIDLRDTVAFTASSYYGCVAVSIANPRSPYTLDSLPLDGWMTDVVVVDTLAYVGGSTLYIVDINDPGDLRVVGAWSPPQTIRRLVWEPPYLYAACYEAGVCILESLQTGLQEADPADSGQPGIQLVPSVTTGTVELVFPARLRRYDAIEVYDAAGSKAKEMSIARSGPGDRVRLDLSQVRAGVYVVSVRAGGSRYTTKVVKTTRGR